MDDNVPKTKEEFIKWGIKQKSIPDNLFFHFYFIETKDDTSTSHRSAAKVWYGFHQLYQNSPEIFDITMDSEESIEIKILGSKLYRGRLCNSNTYIDTFKDFIDHVLRDRKRR